MEAQELDALQVTHEILSSILSPLADAQSQQGIDMALAWLADHMENVMIYGILTNRCPVCIAPQTNLETSQTHLHTRQHSRTSWARQTPDYIRSYMVAIAPFPGFTRPNKAYRAVTQWQGKEMRNLLRVLLAIFTAALSRRTDAPAIATRHKASCHKAILCVRYLTDFILIAQYTVHTPEQYNL
ncbi:hypothetical protein BGX38DRAFT_1143717 [Terfezia claveryi]|nr:hypothetical protein BGX38DRAFT_1143717 [Terfezia claveryi]